MKEFTYSKDLSDYKEIELDGEMVSVDEFSEDIGITWTDGLVMTHTSELIKGVDLYKLSDKELGEIVDMLNLQEFALISNKSCGYGVITKRNIPKESYIMLYSGEYSVHMRDVKDERLIYAFAYELELDKHIVIDAQNFGNYARFVNHLPSKHNLKRCYDIDDYTANSVATANLRQEVFLYQGYPLILFKAIKNIEEGEQLGFDYGNFYWKNTDIDPLLFYKKSDIIYPELYTYHNPLRAMNNYLKSREIMPKFNLYAFLSEKERYGVLELFDGMVSFIQNSGNAPLQDYNLSIVAESALNKIEGRFNHLGYFSDEPKFLNLDVFMAKVFLMDVNEYSRGL